MTELLACLGQEVAKIDALSELLLQQGMDKESIQAILDEVCSRESGPDHLQPAVRTTSKKQHCQTGDQFWWRFSLAKGFQFRKLLMDLQVEAKMGYEAAEGEAEAEASETEAPAILTGSAADLSFLSQPFDDAEGDWSFS